MNDPSVAARTAAAVQTLAGLDSGDPPGPAVLLRQLSRAAHDLGVHGAEDAEQMGFRRARWRPLLRRTLAAAASVLLQPPGGPPEPAHPELLDDLRKLTEAAGPAAAATAVPDLRSTLLLAESIAAHEPDGLRTMILLGAPAALAVALARLTQQKIFLVPWADAPAADWNELLAPLGLDLYVADPAEPGDALPFWLQGRAQSVVLLPPLDPLASLRSVAMALAALEERPGRRLYWTGHPGRHAAYFGLYSRLGRRGLFLERLLHDRATLALDPQLAPELLAELREAPEPVRSRLDEALIDGLLASRVEHEHLHVLCPVDEVVLRGRRLELVPVQAKDIPLYDAWLTPEFCAEVGLEDVDPRPTPEQLRLQNWYPGHEWWLFRTPEGVGVGVVNLILHDFWTTRALPFDIGVAEHSFRGQGLLNEAVRLSFARVFDGLGAEVLWAIVAVANVRICRGYRSNFFQVTGTLTHPETAEEHQHIEVSRHEYRARRQSGDIDVPVESDV